MLTPNCTILGDRLLYDYVTDKVVRDWKKGDDGRLYWRSTRRQWSIALPNVSKPMRKSLRAIDGLFNPTLHDVTLESFLYELDRNAYFHAATRLQLAPRQINLIIFSDRHNWPELRGSPVLPSIFIRRYNRISPPYVISDAFEELNRCKTIKLAS